VFTGVNVESFQLLPFHHISSNYMQIMGT